MSERYGFVCKPDVDGRSRRGAGVSHGRTLLVRIMHWVNAPLRIAADERGQIFNACPVLRRGVRSDFVAAFYLIGFVLTTNRCRSPVAPRRGCAPNASLVIKWQNKICDAHRGDRVLRQDGPDRGGFWEDRGCEWYAGI